MKWALAMLALAGCNQLFGFDDGKLHLTDGGGGTIDAPRSPDATLAPDATPAIDAPTAPDAAPGICDPIANTGCSNGQKCTWIMIDHTTNPPTGQLGCVADGNIPVGGTCSVGPDGATTGYDNCTGGHICAGASGQNPGMCESVCSLTSGCSDTTTRCGQYSGQFEPNTFGACDFECDPVSQTRLSDGAAYCGSQDTTNPDRGCYKFDERPGICALVPNAARTLKQDDTPLGPGSGQAYLNGCAAGYMPMSGSAAQPPPLICVAYCTPTSVNSANVSGEGGLGGSGHTCADRGAANHECKYFYFFDGTSTNVDNGVGICWTPANYVGDWDNDATTPNTAFPACNTLSPNDTDGDGIPQYVQYDCAPLP